jgi:hypothetical protein
MRCDAGQVNRIDVLPDDVLLGVFDFYVDMMSLSYWGRPGIEAWQSLVHVCRRWRSLVLASPRRLNLRLFCTPETPPKGKLDVWPALPLIIKGDMALSGTDNVIAALGQSNRVCQVFLSELAAWQLEKVLAAMQVPFPELTDLALFSGEIPPVIPDSFLDGSAPRLQSLRLCGVPFPGLPKLLLSATHLVQLLLNTPHSGYISPEAIVAPLSVMSSLRRLGLRFQSPQSCPALKSRSLRPQKRFILPALNEFQFSGVTEYLEDLVTRIDTPHLDQVYISFYNQIDFDCPRLTQFINRTPTLRARDKAHVELGYSSTSVSLLSRSRTQTLRISISCRGPDRQLSSAAQVCNSSLHLVSTVEVLYIGHPHWRLVWSNDTIENTQWLQLLLPFTAVKDLYLFKEFAPGIAAALQELVRGGRVTEVLPSLKNIFVEGYEPSGPVQENIGQFVAARRHSDHPIAMISHWNKDSYMIKWI